MKDFHLQILPVSLTALMPIIIPDLIFILEKIGWCARECTKDKPYWNRMHHRNLSVNDTKKNDVQKISIYNLEKDCSKFGGKELTANYKSTKLAMTLTKHMLTKGNTGTVDLVKNMAMRTTDVHSFKIKYAEHVDSCIL